MATADVPEIEVEEEDPHTGLILVELGPKALNMNKIPGKNGLFHEWDDRHPENGELLVVHGRVCWAYRTQRVSEAIARRFLKESKAKAPTIVTHVNDMIDSPPATPQVAQMQAQLTTQAAQITAQADQIKQLLALAAGQAATKDDTAKASKKALVATPATDNTANDAPAS